MSKTVRIRVILLSFAVCSFFVARTAVRAEEAKNRDIVLEAIEDELTRTMKDLVLEGLPRPYFTQYVAEDRVIFSLNSSYNGLVRSDDNRTRSIRSRVRVGSPTLDNTNVGGGFGGRAALPLEDDYVAVRFAVWQATDGDYKRAVETLARKEAFLKEKTVEDRPDDFTSAEPQVELRPKVDFSFDMVAWEKTITRLSGRFKKYPEIQDAQVNLFVGAQTQWLVNSEGTRLRLHDTGVVMQIAAELQAAEGMELSDSRSYMVEKVDQLPSPESIEKDIDELCTNLIRLKGAPLLEHYVGPVLFEAPAACRVLDAMLSDAFCATPTPLGAGGSERSLEKKIGTRILPRTFQVYDDPTTKVFGSTFLAGAYDYDDEGVRTRRVDLVDGGVLKTLLAGRAPTRKIKQTTGHARSGGFGDPEATPGCLYFVDKNGVNAEELKRELIDAAKDEGLGFAIRVAAIDEGRAGELGEPLYAYKVSVADGKEELIRGMHFLPVDMRSLKRLIVAGDKPHVFNSTNGVGYSVIAPAVLFEELEMTKVEREFDKLPILAPPGQRSAQTTPGKP